MPSPYILPQVQVFQEFTEISPEITNPLRAWIIGPNANLFRYSDEDEKSLIRLGTYNPDVEETYDWPHKTAASVVDQKYAKLFIDDAKLRYFQDLIGAGSTVVAVSGYKNRIRSNTLCFKTTTGNPRSAAFLERDVKPGDLVYVRGAASGNQDDLWTYVRALVPEVVASSVDAPDDDVSNADAQSESVTIAQVAGDVNQLSLIADLSDYNAYIDGAIDDVYTVTVVSGSVGGDLTTAKLKITTASGYEYLTNVVPDEVDEVVAVGSRGLQIGFELSGMDSESVSDGIDPNDLVPGQQWRITIGQAYTKPNLASSGTYVGKIDNTYIVTVTSGGFFDDVDVRKRPRVSITSAYGLDGATNVVVDNGEAVPLGSGGASLTFNADTGALGLVKGDKFYVPVTAATTGRTSTIVLGHDLSDVLQDAADLDLELYIKANIEVPRYVTDPVPQYNWETSETEVTINPDIHAFVDGWTSGGEAQPLPVLAGSLYIEYREWLNTLVREINGISDISEIDEIEGALDPDNPLKWAVSKAVANCGGTGVRYTAISDPSELADWTAALSLGTERRDLYSLVPLTTDRDVIDLFVAHVNTMSSETKARWRKVFVPLVAEEVSPRVTAALADDEEVVLGTISDDPETSGTQYTLASITSGNAGFLDLKVAVGDLFRTNFTEDAEGVVTYDEYVIAEVVNEQTLRLEDGPATPITLAQKIEVHHRNSKNELAIQLGTQAGTYGNRRVCAVWPDVVGSAGRTYPSYHLCAALAGLAGGVVPQQHLTNVEITGFDDLKRTTKLFSSEQLDTLASYGVWIVTQNVDGNIISRDALTTDMTSLQSKTEMVVRNVDSISYLMYSRLEKYIGRANLVQTTIDLIRIELVGAIEFLKSNGFTVRLGGQLIDATIIDLRQHVIQKDRLVAAIRLDIPFPLNVIELHLIA